MSTSTRPNCVPRARRILAVAVAAAGALLATVGSVAKADVILDTGNTSQGYTYFYNGASAGGHALNFTSLPTTVSDAQSGGGNSATTAYALSGTSFDLGFSHARTGTINSYAQSLGYLYFDATDATTSYGVSGSYSFSGVSGSYSFSGAPSVYLSVELYDLTANQFAYESYQELYTAPSTGAGTLTVGGSAGTYHDLQGSASGLLIQGHTYQAYYNAFIQVTLSTEAGATASGNVRFAFTDSAAPAVTGTPLPSSAMGGLVLMGGVSVMQLVRSRRTSAGVFG